MIVRLTMTVHFYLQPSYIGRKRGLFHGFVGNLLLKPGYEVRLVFTEWLAQLAAHLWGDKKILRLAPHIGDAPLLRLSSLNM